MNLVKKKNHFLMAIVTECRYVLQLNIAELNMRDQLNSERLS